MSPPLPPGLDHEQRTAAILRDRHRTLLGFSKPGRRDRRAVPASSRTGFTLIELLTVITIIAILATLLMTSLSSVKRKAREAVCTSNLRQIGIALQIYLEDFGQRPGDLRTLAASKYVGDGRILTCPADRGSVHGADLVSDVKGIGAPQANNAARTLHVSYQHPLGWPDEEWNRLMQAQTRAGVVACTFHDVRAAARNSAAATPAAEGLILRGQLDGSVVRRQVFRKEAVSNEGVNPPVTDRSAAGPTTAFGSTDNAVINANFPPWDFFSDDPPPL